MSVTRFAVVVAACAALAMLPSRVGKSQEGDAKGKPAVAEKWADDPAPPDRDDRVGPPGGPTQGPPDDGDRNGPPPDGRRPGGPRGEPRQGPPDEGMPGMGPGGPGGPGMRPGQGRPGMGPGGPGRGPGGPGMGGPMGGAGMGRPEGGPRDHLEFLEKNDPEMYKLVKADMDLERQTRQLAMQYRQASSDQRAKLKEKIKDVVGKHFDVRQDRRALELKRLEAELQRLRESMDRRLKAREKLVEQRVSDLVGHEEETGF
jgi:hypothetical protein